MASCSATEALPSPANLRSAPCRSLRLRDASGRAQHPLAPGEHGGERRPASGRGGQLAFKEPSRGGRDNRFRDDLLTTGATPLLRAAQTFDNEVVQLLLEYRALVDLPNASGVNAAETGRTEVVRCLLER